MSLSAFSLSDKVVAVTGGSGVLGSALCRGFASAGATVVVFSQTQAKAQKIAESLGPGHSGLSLNVLDRASIEAALDLIMGKHERVDVLVNCAGGNHPRATTNQTQSFFDLPGEDLEFVSQLNLAGTILPSQIFGKYFAAQKAGCILNVSSMSAFRPLTRIPAYSAAKAAVSNFTQWLAVHLAQEYSPNIRVNALAPGFFLTEQNRFLLTEEGSGHLTPRGQKIIDHTPQGRFGDPDDLIGAAVWLVSDAARFVTGIVVPVDGGFSAYGGV